MTSSLIWLRRDLRLRDNAALRAACAADRVFAVYCLADLEPLNSRQRAFVLGSLRALRTALEKRDATVTLLHGEQGTALADAARRLGATEVHCSRTYTIAERHIEEAAAATLQAHGIMLHRHKGDMVHEPEAIAAAKQSEGEGYRVFPPFLAAWQTLDVDVPGGEAFPNGRDGQPGPLEESDEASPVTPGEAAANTALERFITARAADYAVNGAYPARDGTSHLAPYLRFGCISPRVVYQAISRRMAFSWTLVQERRSMATFLRQLARRDFFTQLAYFVPGVHDQALQQKMRDFPWSRDAEKADRWAAGLTGYPLVDAAMRQLHDRGLVHQRAAIVAASFCCFDLGLDWRIGRDVWMNEHLAADVALADGNWQWLAGVGSDQAAYPRIYNPEKQARQFDAQAVYVRRWIPELRRLPTQAALAPWRLDRQHQIELSFFTPDQYPHPIVKHETAAREFLARYRDFREPPFKGSKR